MNKFKTFVIDNFTMKTFSLLLTLFILIITLDQSSKLWIYKNLYLHQSIKICDFFDIVRVHNYGISFGIFNNGNQNLWLLYITIFIIICISVWICKNRSFLLGGILVISGAIGNVIDRLHFGYVIDFLDFHVFGYHWPAFNVADIAISIGNVIILLICLCDNNVAHRK